MQGKVRVAVFRYINHLDPGVNKECWSDSELEILYNKYAEYGNKWFLLQKYLPGRYSNIDAGLKQRSKTIFMAASASS